MSQGANKLAVGVNIIKLAPSIIHLIELFSHGASGADKKAAALDTAKQLATSAGEVALANNPHFQSQYGGLIDAVVATANSAGTMPEPVITIPPIPPPPGK